MPRCEALNSRGEPCAAPDAVVDPDTRRCPAHAEGGREEMRARARMGAQATRQRWQKKGLASDELPALRSPQDAERWAEITARAVAEKRLSHADGRTIATLLREWGKSHSEGRVAQRVEELKKQVAELKKAKR
jgi:hypothetical protein